MNNNFDNCGLEWHTNKLCKKGGGIGLPLSPCSIGGCQAMPPHLAITFNIYAMQGTKSIQGITRPRRIVDEYYVH